MTQGIGGISERRSRPLDAVYPVVLIDAIHVKIRDEQVADRPVYVAVGIRLRRGTRRATDWVYLAGWSFGGKAVGVIGIT